MFIFSVVFLKHFEGRSGFQCCRQEHAVGGHRRGIGGGGAFERDGFEREGEIDRVPKWVSVEGE